MEKISSKTESVTVKRNGILRPVEDEAKQYWIRLIVEAYKRLYEHNGFTECEIVSNFNAEYHRLNNHILDFFEENPTKDHWIGKGKLESYKQYKEWCQVNEEQYPLGKEKFHTQLLEHYDLDYGKMNLAKGKKETSTTCYKPKKSTD
jgi:putative DNA primase/helicase